MHAVHMYIYVHAPGIPESTQGIDVNTHWRFYGASTLYGCDIDCVWLCSLIYTTSGKENRVKSSIVPRGPRGTSVSEREIERARANIFQSQGGSQLVRIADIELLQSRS